MSFAPSVLQYFFKSGPVEFGHLPEYLFRGGVALLKVSRITLVQLLYTKNLFQFFFDRLFLNFPDNVDRIDFDVRKFFLRTRGRAPVVPDPCQQFLQVSRIR